MSSPLVPTLPVVMTKSGAPARNVGTAADYWDALWEGYTVNGPVPPPPRSAVPAHLSDLDALSGTFAPVVSAGFKRVKTRNAAILRPKLRDISTRVARTKPLIAATNTTSSILNQTNTTLTASSPEFNYWGSVAWQVVAQGFCSFDPHSSTYNPPWVAEFCTDSPLFAVEMTGGGQLIEVLVNGEQVRAPATLSGGAWMLVDWNGVRAVRRYTIRGQGGMALKTIRRNVVDSLFAPKKDNDVKAAWVTDSYGQTVGLDGISTLPMLASDMLGWKVAASAEGGSGYDQPNPATTVSSFQARVPDVIAAAPDIVVLAGGHNIRNAPTEQASVVATIQALQAGLPGVPILAFGPFYGSGPTFGEAGYAAEAAAIQAACAATGATYLSTSGWITGTGKVGTPANDGNADVLISSDGTHPQTGIGGDYFAARCADAITGSAAI